MATLRALLLLLLVFPAFADPVEAWADGWRKGTVFAEYGSYADLYANTKEREIRFVERVQEGDLVLALYETRVTDLEGKVYEQSGVAIFYLKDGKVYTEEHVVLEGRTIDQALAGQLADIASTGVALSSGLSELNPLGQTPGGLAALVVAKLAAPSLTKHLDTADCITSRQGLAGFGWGAAAWNIAAIAGLSPPVGAVLAILAGWHMADRKDALKNCVLDKTKR